MGVIVRTYLDCKHVVVCRKCRTHLADSEEVISKEFQGQHGRAYLYNNIYNYEAAPSEVKTMTTGQHEVSDISCIYCGAKLGWKYIKAYEQSQVYKVGHFILERALVTEVEQESEETDSNE